MEEGMKFLPPWYNQSCHFQAVVVKAKAIVDYGSMSLQDLRTELRKRKAKLSSRKHELVTRLESYDRNFNFGKFYCDEGSFQMTTPEAAMYLDVNSHSKIPEVSEKNIRAFHAFHEQDLYGKAKSLYYGKFLNSIRYCRQDDNTYILGRVSAEMKTKGAQVLGVKANPFWDPKKSHIEKDTERRRQDVRRGYRTTADLN